MNTDKQLSVIGLVLTLIMLLTMGLIPAVAQDDGESFTEAVESANGMLTLNYPTGWVVDLSIPSMIRLATNQAMLDADMNEIPLPSGEFQVVILEGDLLNVIAPGWDSITALDEAIELANTYVLAEGTTIVRTESMVLAGYPALVEVTLQPDREGLVGVIDFDGSYVLVGINSQIGEYADYADLGLAILDTLRYSGLAPAQPITSTGPAADNTVVEPLHENALPLTETYTLKSGYSFGYPHGWKIVYELNEPDISLVSLGSNDTVASMGGFGYDFAPGDVWVSWTWESLKNFSGDLDADASPVEVLNNSIIGLYPDMGDAEEVQLGEHSIALAEGVHESGIPMMAVFFFWDDDTIGWFLALTAPSEYEQFKPTLLAIAESSFPDSPQPATSTENSLLAEPLPLTETHTVENGYSFSYPAGWVTSNEYNDTIYAEIVLGNSEAAIQGWFGEQLAAGTTRIDFGWEVSSILAPGVSTDVSGQDVLNSLIGGAYLDMGEPYETQLGNADVAIAEGIDNAENAMLVVVFHWQDDIWGYMFALTPPDDYEQIKPTLLAIAESALPEAPAEVSAATSLGPVLDTLSETTAVSVPDSISGPEECYNVALSINDYSSEFGGTTYSPLNLLDDNPATGWSSAGGTAVEFVEIDLAGTHTIYGVLFNSYSPSPRYETDSIKGFAIETTLPDGTARAIFKGQAVLTQGYQSYLFDPVETDRVRFIFNNTHGGGYFEAADIMVCALASGYQVDAPNTMPEPATVELRQWASQAQATSQYSDAHWSAQQATGVPDTVGCGDMGTAWASSAADGVDKLTVFFSTPVIPTQVQIYQTFNPGAITSVELIPATSGAVIPLPNSADSSTGCPGVFTIDVPAALTEGRLVSGVAIQVDQRNHTGWNEIDAVELVGEAQISALVSHETGTLAPLPTAITCNVRAQNRINMRGGPGTSFNVAGQLRGGTVMPANGQITGADGYTWWRLTYGSWVRADVVDTAANCPAVLPIIAADDPLPLTQRYVTPDGFSFDYPQDWFLVEEPGGASVGNSWEAAQNPFGEPYYSGEFQLSIRWLTVNELAPDTGLAAGATPMQVLRAAISVSSGLDMNEPYELQIGDQIVAAAYGTLNDTNVEIAVIVFEAPDGIYGSVLTGSDLRGLEQFEPTVRAIIASALVGSR